MNRILFAIDYKYYYLFLKNGSKYVHNTNFITKFI